MVHFEFGQNRLTELHPKNTFELAQGAIKVPLESQIRHILGNVQDVLGVYPTEHGVVGLSCLREWQFKAQMSP